MSRRIFVALPVLGALAFAGSAKADTLYFALGGDGNVSVSGTLTISPDPNADTKGIFGTPANLVTASPTPPKFQGKVDPANALAVTDVTGTFSDVALGITGATITSLIITNPQPHYDPDYTIPVSFGWFPGVPATVVSYDNLFYSGSGAPLTCLPTLTTPTFPGGYFDNYGVMFSLSNGDIVDMYSNGQPPAGAVSAAALTGDAPTNAIYGVVVWADGVEDKTSEGGLSLTVPEPSTWVMMILGFAGLGFAGYRKSSKAAAIAV